MNKEVNVTITPRTVLMTLVIAAGAYALWILRGLALLVLTAIIIASAMEPGVVMFKRWKVPRTLAVVIMYVMVFGSTFGFIYYFFPPILNDTQNFLSIIPQYLNTLNLPVNINGVTSLGTTVANTHQAQTFVQTLLEFRSAFSADTSEGAFRLISTIFGGIFSLFIVVTLSFYFAVQETGVETFLRIVTPTEYEKYVVGLWHRAQVKIGQWMQGQLLLSVLISVVIYLGLVLFKVPDSLMLAVFTAFAEIIPIFGSFIAWFPAVIIGYTSGGLAMALFVTGLYIVVNQFEGNLIHPLIVKKVVGVPPLLVLIAIIAGGDLAGFLGVLLAVPLAAVLREAISDFERRKRHVAESRAVSHRKTVKSHSEA